MIVIDTGPVVAAANRKDDYHERCTELLQGFPGPLLLPVPLITEIGYMLYSRAGSRAEADFLRDVADGVYELVQVTAPDASRAADLVEQYSNLPLGTADAIVVAVAERFRAVNIATWTGATSAWYGPRTQQHSLCSRNTMGPAGHTAAASGVLCNSLATCPAARNRESGPRAFRASRGAPQPRPAATQQTRDTEDAIRHDLGAASRDHGPCRLFSPDSACT